MPRFKLVGFFAAVILMGIAQVSPEGVQARTDTEKEAAALSPKKEVAVVDGFRSAHFGMSQKKVLKSILKDFDIEESNVKRENNTSEKTTSLAVDVPDLLPGAGLGRVVYIFGYKTKKLIQVNVLWGLPVTSNPDAQALVAMANVLRNHFLKKEYNKDSLAFNLPLNDGSVLVFRGTDQKGRMILLLLNNPPNLRGKDKTDTKPKLSLRLSYIEKPTTPDIFRIKGGDF